jgi:opacity protein-like surface antigen
MIRLRFLILITLVNSSILTFGQTNKFEAGLEFGPSLKSLRGNDFIDDNKDISFGFSVGLTFQYNFPKLISIRTNISYEKKGSSSKFKATDELGNPIGDINFGSNFDYLIIPLLVRFTFFKRTNFFVNAGPYFGYLIKQRNFTEAFGEFPKEEIDNIDNYKRNDFGISAGLGVRFPIKNKLFLSLEIRSNIGISNISSFPIPSVNDWIIKTNSTNLLIGFEYRFGARAND